MTSNKCKKRGLNLSYTRIIALGFLTVIAVGTLLLCLPVSSRSGEATPLINSAFTATSATCVTGLTVYDTYSHWSLFGQIVILLLIQIGGLGFMTVITMFSIFMKRQISLHERILLMQTAGTMRHAGVTHLIKRVLIGTFIFEGTGMLLLSIRFVPEMGAVGLWYALFHSVSSFCNAGFDLMGRFGGASLTEYVGDPLVCITVMALIVIGGIGFLVWSDIVKFRFSFKKYELHTKIVLVTSAVLLFGGAVIFYFTEKNAAFSELSMGEKWLAAFFQSVTTRTAGYYSVDQASLSSAGSILSIVLMFIGGAPGSTAGGIKTVTLAVIVMSIISSARNRSNTVIFKRKIDPATVRQAYSIAGIYLAAVLVFSTVLCAVHPSVGIREALFEIVSAIGTVGLSMSLTPTLGAFAKFIVMLMMYAGRIGGLSLVLALAEKRDAPPIERPTGKIIIG